ncbi:hypothetical protein RQX57_004160 [Vibrio vulnificus]|nr:hypothetical protein [Vibrio vulnificus]
MNEKLVNMIEGCGLEVEDVAHIIKEAQGMAVMNFVNVQIGAFEAGFIKTSDCTLFEMHKYARIHVKDNYNMETPNFSDTWSADMICHCSGGSMPK